MKKRLLSGSLFAVLTNTASAMVLNPDGIGQVLLYPYYTVNAGNQTLVTVVNTQNVGKVAKVRFREGYDGRPVLDFNLYLSPYDVWTATVFDTQGLAGHAGDTSAAAGLLTPDNSCTDPAIKAGSAGFTESLPDGRNFVSFVNYAYAVPLYGDGGPSDVARTRTGHIELIQMADVVGATLVAITHVDGIPVNCASVIGAQPSPDYVSPSGGLFGSTSIVNVQAGTLFAANAEAVNGFYTNSGNLFAATPSVTPDLRSGDNGNITAGAAVSYVFAEDGTTITSAWPLDDAGSIDAVSSVFIADSALNEFESNLPGSVISEWIVTFPTKSYYADPTLTAPVAPFTRTFGADPANPGTACELVTIGLHDREERVPPIQTEFSSRAPGPPLPAVCWESEAIPFAQAAVLGETSPIFGTPLYLIGVDPLRNLGITGTSGTLAMTFSGNGHTMHPSIEGHVFVGLPAIGFLAKQYTNNNVMPGVLGNYAGTYRHHLAHACSKADGSACQ